MLNLSKIINDIITLYTVLHLKIVKELIISVIEDIFSVTIKPDFVV